jgi:ABC-2 type transport system ATP-binding protein
VLDVQNVTFLYGPHRGVEDVSFTMQAGECLGIVGGNGVGKSTLLGLLAGALVPQSGTIQFVNGERSMRKKRFFSHQGLGYRLNVGYMSEVAPVYEELTVARYLRLRSYLRGENFLRIRRRLNDALERCGLSKIRGEIIGRLSHGTRRRIALAEALITLPKILVLDDPFAGLDAEMRADFVTIIREIISSTHVIISGHDWELLSVCCSRFLVLKKDTPGIQQLSADEASKTFALPNNV